MKDLVGKTFGEYRLVKHIGSGGMADVYLAEQTTLERSVAVKVLKPALMNSSGERVVSRFRQEAMTAAALSHANIVQVYTIGHEGDYHFIAQEYVRGKDLASILKIHGIPELHVALHVIRQMAAALAAAGNAGIVHRDIKPDNVLVDKNGVVKVADFGLAQLQEKSEPGGLTLEGTTLGTPLYMSPEQVRGEDLDQRSDIYSFGITCYQMLCNRTPFTGNTATGIAVQHITTMAPPLSEENPDLPDVICRMVHCMIAKRRSQRYQTAGAILNDVKILQTAVRQKRSLDLVRLPELSQIEKITGKAVTESSAVPAEKKKNAPARVSSSFVSTDVQKAKDRRLSGRRAPDMVLGNRQWVSLPSWEELDDDEIGLGRRRPEFEETDLTPMVDVTFLLLIFFMITAAFDLQKKFDVAPARLEEAVEVTLDDTDDPSLLIEIGHDNVVYIGDEKAQTYEDILGRLETAHREDADLDLQLRIDPDSRHEMRIRVNDAGTQAGFSRIRTVFGTVE
ncbi:MAG: protein kinase [Fuerstiella sp.]|nr:protein kinase [Fuerstiella sp.]